MEQHVEKQIDRGSTWGAHCNQGQRQILLNKVVIDGIIVELFKQSLDIVQTLGDLVKIGN